MCFSSNEHLLHEAGKTLDTLFIDNPTLKKNYITTNGHMDARTILTMKASRKNTHITLFVSEKMQATKSNRRREFVLRSAQAQKTILLKAEEEHPYLGIHI